MSHGLEELTYLVLVGLGLVASFGAAFFLSAPAYSNRPRRRGRTSKLGRRSALS